MKRIILIILVVGLIGAFATWKYVFRKADTSVSSQKADIEIAADSLFYAFETSETSANALYLNKIILVTGTISEITTNELGYSIYLKNTGEMSGVLCGFSEKLNDADMLKAGDLIKVKGICAGYLMDVNLTKCALEK